MTAVQVARLSVRGERAQGRQAEVLCMWFVAYNTHTPDLARHAKKQKPKADPGRSAKQRQIPSSPSLKVAPYTMSTTRTIRSNPVTINNNKTRPGRPVFWISVTKYFQDEQLQSFLNSSGSKCLECASGCSGPLTKLTPLWNCRNPEDGSYLSSGAVSSGPEKTRRGA